MAMFAIRVPVVRLTVGIESAVQILSVKRVVEIVRAWRSAMYQAIVNAHLPNAMELAALNLKFVTRNLAARLIVLTRIVGTTAVVMFAEHVKTSKPAT